MTKKRQTSSKWQFFFRLSVSGLAVAAVIFILFWTLDLFLSQKSANLEYGVTFSAPYAQSLGLNSDEVYHELLSDLKVKKIRLPVYWNLVENQPNKFNFTQTDKQLDQAKTYNARVVLAIGYKLPRWPECYQPSWAVNLNQKQRQDKILNYLKNTINHFKNRPEVAAWQVENEPLLNFGLCENLDSEFLEEEVKLVRSLDSRPVIITDSGELGDWIRTMGKSDYLGMTLYRKVWNPIFGLFNYPMPPLFYNLKAQIIKAVFAPNSKGVFITELQTEPWPPGKAISEIPLKEQLKGFNLKQFQDTISFAQRTGFSQQYLWGVEWWYFLKTQGHPEYWEYARSLFK